MLTTLGPSLVATDSAGLANPSVAATPMVADVVPVPPPVDWVTVVMGDAVEVV